jgi:hypothetical protein
MGLMFVGDILIDQYTTVDRRLQTEHQMLPLLAATLNKMEELISGPSPPCSASRGPAGACS